MVWKREDQIETKRTIPEVPSENNRNRRIELDQNATLAQVQEVKAPDSDNLVCKVEPVSNYIMPNFECGRKHNLNLIKIYLKISPSLWNT